MIEDRGRPPDPVRGERATALGQTLAAYRSLREGIERDILPVATSVDGVEFVLQASLHDLRLRRGGYVVLASAGVRRLGQINDLATATVETRESSGTGSRTVLVRLVQGRGLVLEGDRSPFHDARVTPARPEEVRAWCSRPEQSRAGLTLGELLLAPGVPATLDSAGLSRHTFMCGQSGSGKTYSLGLLLERVLAETSLRVVVLDPNSDHGGLARLREGADAELSRRYADVPPDVAVWGNGRSADRALRLRFRDLDTAAQAAVLGLDPVQDRDEYAALMDLLHAQRDGTPLVSGPDELLDSEAPGARKLGLRASNLGLLGWRVWGPRAESIVDELRSPTARCTVVDLGSLDTPQEQRLVAEAVLSTLWDTRHSRVPCLVVVDEAHNVCPAEAPDLVTTLSRDRAVQIAAEGRKYGLYLLVSTQRPHKVHDDVVSQCDNLLLMRMNSRADIEDLAQLFSFVPEGLLHGATRFRMGEALVAGRVMPDPTYIRTGERITEEGGADIPATWAEPR